MYSYIVRLNNVTFTATHGLHEHEKRVQQKFEVDIEVSYTREEACLDVIENSVNYEKLYEISHTIIQNNTFSLIETIGEKIIQKIFQMHKNIENVIITIRKPQIKFDDNSKCVEVSISKTNE